MHDNQFLTTEEVMDYLQVNLRTVYRLIRAGRIPAVRIGRQWRFQKSDIDAWLEENRTGGHRHQGVPRIRPTTRPARLLVVDDEQIVRDLLAATLTSTGYEVDSATDGSRAIEMLNSGSYDLLITDVRMPGIDGLTVVREARRLSSTMAIVIITGASSEAIAIEAINLGVNGYLTKPFGVERVLAVVARALGTTRTASNA
jgi:excisionase family DNA binding protein